MRKVYGQGLVEYALVLILIAITVIGILTLLGSDGHVRCPVGSAYSREYGCIDRYTP
jgi:hypothetical protein